MALSMTGFARASGVQDGAAWCWEVRTVNGKGLDIRLRLPSGFEGIEQEARRLCQSGVARGNCTATLDLRYAEGDLTIRLNEPALRQAAVAVEQAREILNAAPAELSTLLGLRGVLEFSERDKAGAEAPQLAAGLLAGLGKALDELRKVRATEGDRLSQAISRLLDEIEAQTSAAARSASRTPDAIRDRLAEQLKRVMNTGIELSEDRLYQEVALLATRADVEEEIERLKAHLSAARDLLVKSEPVGRQFEFLAQEFNREANTVCSKAADLDVTRAGLALKTAIDQLREQVQNIE